MISRISLLAAALLLAACSQEEEKTAQPEPPAAEQPAPAEDQASEGMKNLREGAKQLLEGGRQLSEEAMERADKALEDAEPALRQAGETIRELARQAVEEFEQAVADLQERIDNAEDKNEPVPGDPDAVLAPAEQLNADTRAAARAVAAGIGPDYVGVWAAEPSACAKIDQEAVELFAVITPTTIRRYENVCNFESVPLADGRATVQASCIAEGTTEDRDITFTLPSPEKLQIGRPESPILAELVRCHLPEQQ
jgi:Asp-tRNA(Asn)/Glu-tRNA(Gln) amidotransferase A subunit family amidase